MKSPSEQSENVEAVVEEFLDCHRRGEEPSVADYLAAHPDIAPDLQEMLPAALALEQLNHSQKAGCQMAQLDAAAEGIRTARLGDYRIIRELGRGGMGIVYEAEQESLGRHVALKVMSDNLVSSRTSRERFQREAESSSRLNHPNQAHAL